MEWWIMIYRFLSVLFHLFSVIVWLYGIYFCHSWAFKGVFWKKRGKKAMTLTSKLTYTAPVIYSKTRAFFSIFFHLYILLCPSDSAATVNNRTLWGNLFFPTSFWIFLFDFFDRVESFAFKCQSKCAPQWMTKINSSNHIFVETKKYFHAKNNFLSEIVFLIINVYYLRDKMATWC